MQVACQSSACGEMRSRVSSAGSFPPPTPSPHPFTPTPSPPTPSLGCPPPPPYPPLLVSHVRLWLPLLTFREGANIVRRPLLCTHFPVLADLLCTLHPFTGPRCMPPPPPCPSRPVCNPEQLCGRHQRVPSASVHPAVPAHSARSLLWHRRQRVLLGAGASRACPLHLVPRGQPKQPDAGCVRPAVLGCCVCVLLGAAVVLLLCCTSMFIVSVSVRDDQYRSVASSSFPFHVAGPMRCSLSLGTSCTVVFFRVRWLHLCALGGGQCQSAWWTLDRCCLSVGR